MAPSTLVTGTSFGLTLTSGVSTTGMFGWFGSSVPGQADNNTEQTANPLIPLKMLLVLFILLKKVRLLEVVNIE